MKHVKEFDGLCGLLAAWVLLAHVFYLSHFEQFRVAMRAGMAVDIFLILSGFIIFNLRERGETYGAFITRRFFGSFRPFSLASSSVCCSVNFYRAGPRNFTGCFPRHEP